MGDGAHAVFLKAPFALLFESQNLLCCGFKGSHACAMPSYMGDGAHDDFPCNIERRQADSISLSEFRVEYENRRPVIIVGQTDNSGFALSVSPERLRDVHGLLEVTLSSGNTYSHDKQNVRLATYIDEYLAPTQPDQPANETWYLFGDNQIRFERAGLIDGYR